MKLFFLFFSILLSVFVNAAGYIVPTYETKKESFVLMEDEQGHPAAYNIKGVRYKRDGAVPVIIAHGVFNSYGISEKLARILYSKGYDVWIYNQPGFGQQDNLSLMNEDLNFQDEKKGYGFAGLVQGMDEMINYVSRQASGANKRPVLVGFSLGGWVSDMYLSGVVDLNTQGFFQKDQKIAALRQKKISSAVFIGTPTLSINNDSTKMKKTMIKILSLASLLSPGRGKFLKTGLGNSDFNNTFVGQYIKYASLLAPDFLKNKMMSGGANFSNMDKETQADFSKYLAKIGSTIHTDLLKDIERFNDDLFSPIDKTSILYVVGGKDSLASIDETSRVYTHRKLTNPKHQLMIMPESSHLDMMEFYSLQKLGIAKKIDQFINLNKRNICLNIYN